MVSVDIRISAAKGYPIHPYANGEIYTLFHASANTRAEAIEHIWQQVVEKAEHWKKMVEEDVEFSKTIGRKLVLLKDWDHRIWIDARTSNRVKIPKDSIGTVTAHIPAFIIVDFEERKQCKFPTNKFRSYFSQLEDGKFVNIPDPYCKWI